MLTRNLQQTIKELVDNKWLVKRGTNSYTPSARLRKIVAEQKVASGVPLSNHELKTFAAVARTLKATTADDGQDEVPYISATPRTPRKTPRRRSTRFSLPAHEPSAEEGEAVHRSSGTSEEVDVRTKSKKGRQSDPGPRIQHHATPASSLPSRRRSFGINLTHNASVTNTPDTSRRRRNKKNANRRHTLAVNPTRQPPVVPSGVSREIQFFPLKMALSLRTRRALRRNALSEEMNNIEAEEKAGRRKNREELDRLRGELATYEQRLRELQQELQATRYAPSEEPDQLEPVIEEPEPVDEDFDMDMESDFGLGMDIGGDHADDTPGHTPEPAHRGPITPSPVPLSRQASSSGQGSSVSKRDQKIRNLEAQIDALRRDMEERALEAQRRQEEDEIFHDAEEQILLEENVALAHQIEQLQSPPAERHVEFDEMISVVDEQSIAGEDLPTFMGDHDMSSVGGDSQFRSSGIDSGIVASSMPMSEEADPRIIDLEEEKDKLERSLGAVKDKLRELQEDYESALTSSEENCHKAEALFKENASLRVLGDELSTRITELEELEDGRLENVDDLAVQTEKYTDEEKEELLDEVADRREQVDELQQMLHTVSKEKDNIETGMAELKAQIKALQLSVETGNQKKGEAEEAIERMSIYVKELEIAREALDVEKAEMKAEMESLRVQIDCLVEEVEGLRLANVGLQEQLVDKDKLVGGLTEELKELNGRVTEFELSIDSMKDEIQSANRQLRQKDVTIDSLENEKAALQDELEDRSEAMGDLEADKSALEVEVDRLEESLEESTNQLEDLQEKLAIKEQEIEELSQSGARAIGTAFDKAESIRLLEQEKATLEEQVSALAEDIEESKAEISSLEEELADKEHDIRELQRSNDSLEEELADREQTIEALEERNASLSDESKATGQVVFGLEQEKSSLQGQVELLESNADELNSRISKLDLQNLDLNGQLAQHTGEITVLGKRILGLEEIDEALKTANEMLQVDKNSLEKTVKELQHASQLSQERRDELMSEIVSLQEQIADLEASGEAVHEDFSDQIAKMRGQITAQNEAAEFAVSEKASAERDINRLEARISELESLLEKAEDNGDILRNEIFEAKTQIEGFRQLAESATLQHNHLQNETANLRVQLDATKKSLKSAEAAYEQKLNMLNEEAVERSQEIAALKVESRLMQREATERQSRLAEVTDLLELSQKNNESLKQSIDELEDKVASLESELKSTNTANEKYLQELCNLRDQIAEMTREAQAVDEEKFIIAQKIQPYIAGEQSLDMAVDEVLTELVMAKNHAAESESLRKQLVGKIRILAQDGSGEFSPEEVVEKLIDRFKDVRKRVEDLYNKRRELKDSHFAGQDLEDFAWTGSNDSALQVLGALVEQLDGKLMAARDGAKDLQSTLGLERLRAQELDGYLRDVLANVDDSAPALDKGDIPSFVERHVLGLENQIVGLEDRLADLEGIIRNKDTTIRTLEADLEEAKRQTTDVSKVLDETRIARNATFTELTVARKQIKELRMTTSEDRMEIDKLEQTINHHKVEQERLCQKLDDQAEAHMAELQSMRQEKMVAIGAVENKLADAVDGKNHLQRRLEEITADYASQVRDLQSIVSGSKEEAQSLEETIVQLKRQHQGEIDGFQSRIEIADRSIDGLQQELRRTEAKADIDIAALQIELQDDRKDSEDRIAAVEAKLEEQQRLGQQLQADLDERVLQIKEMEQDILNLKQKTDDREAYLQDRINELESELQNVRFSAGKEKIRLEEMIREREVYIEQLEARASDLHGFLLEAEEVETRLTEELEEARAGYQLYVDEAVERREELLARKAEAHNQLEDTRTEMATMKATLSEEIARLSSFVNTKTVEIGELGSTISILDSEKRTLQSSVSILEIKKRELEEELEIERGKGREAMESMQKEAERFITRLGDQKGQYLREQKHRESRKRGYDEVSHEFEERVFKEPLSPASTSRKLTTTENLRRGAVKRRNGGKGADSGIGIDNDDDDDFGGSIDTTGGSSSL
jgi:chromosome segregation ATPase